jgi:hypothetical protein
VSVFLQRQGPRGQQRVAAKHPQCAVELVREFDGFSGVAAVAGQGRQGNGVPAQSDGVIRVDHALVVQSQAAGQVKASRQGTEVAGGVGGGATDLERRLANVEQLLAKEEAATALEGNRDRPRPGFRKSPIRKF